MDSVMLQFNKLDTRFLICLGRHKKKCYAFFFKSRGAWPPPPPPPPPPTAGVWTVDTPKTTWYCYQPTKNHKFGNNLMQHRKKSQCNWTTVVSNLTRT